MSNIVLPNIKAAQRLIKYTGFQNIPIINAVKNGEYLGRIPNLITKDEPIGTSSLGTPIYTDLTLVGGFSYTDNISEKTVTIENDVRIETVLITVTQPVRVIKTEIQGRDGTVKEYIGRDDAHITINGVITGSNGVYPREQVKALKEWLDAPVSKSIVTWWLDNLGISEIVVENYTIPQVQGGYSYQMFSIDAISDIPVQLRITSGNV